ncbi:cupin domain-containing carboxymuconolactone decarboxylase family protein [Oceanobacter antarcticus]|uniref:Carboxymuconolactone decarboxylase family protein n=1 Tax=Oceanobacter antarcticus TaxID=3133425 RepID=A0ABW8NP57_9GAMM
MINTSKQFHSLWQLTLLLTTMSVVTIWVSESHATPDSGQHQVVTRKAELVEAVGPATNFNGHAVYTRFPVMPTQGAVAPATVTFESGAVTNWHVHPHGQYLIVVAGEGRIQEWGGEVQVIRVGDTVWCPPGVKHWHGGGAHTGMTHIAISPVVDDGSTVTWLEPVTFADSQTSEVSNKPVPEVPVELSARQLAIVPIAAFNATGDLNQLKTALQAGLEQGLTINEIKEVLSHQYAYVGFPRSLNGLGVFQGLLAERQQAGIVDPVGRVATVSPRDTDYYQLGTETLIYLTRGPASRPMYDFAPVMDHTLKTHLFGYLFSRDNLSYINRELTTIATLAALGNVNSQLISHFKVAGNLGLNRKHLNQAISMLDQKVGAEVAENAARQLASLAGF